MSMRDSARFSGHVIFYGILATIVVLAIALAGAYLTGFFSDVTADRRGQTEQRERTVGDGDYRIANYDAFFDRCEAIVATEGDIAATREQLNASTDETQRFYDQQNLRAQEAQRRTLVAQYNADAAKAGTAGQFRDSNLPARIDLNGATTCAA
ncbi:MAG: hypothetical protein ACRDTZ_07290 [Pseudonocardiaceae bacterium]